MFRLPSHRLYNTMRVHLEYGRTGLEVDLPDRNVVGCFISAGPAAGGSGGRGRQLAGRPARRRWLTCPRPPQRLRGHLRHDPARAQAKMLLPPILETLEAAGIPRGEILILVATGMHRPNLGERTGRNGRSHVAENYRIENHHGQQRDEHTYLGQTRGTPVWIDSR